MKKRSLVFLFLSFFAVMLLSQTTVFADDMNFSVEANIPENQIDKSQTYFDLRMKPDQKQEISITLKNGSDVPATIAVIPHTAVTNQNGVIDYSKELTKDSSLKHEFTDLISGETEYKLGPKETKKAVFYLKMPKEPFQGTILGGFRIQKVQKEDEQNKNQSVQIKNQYAYVIGTKLTETDDTVTPELKLNDITPTLQNYHTAVSANLQNTQPVIISGLEVNAQISKKKGQEVLHETNKSDMSMAPNSNFDYTVDWDDQELKAGAYHLSITAKDNHKHEWKFEKDFEIKAKDVKPLNKEAIELSRDYTLWIGLGICFIVFGVSSLILFFKRRKKRIEKEKKRIKAMKIRQKKNKKKKVE
ncbi:DUF916 and DUF3324 domain-containing protein [Enterococcus caccae]|uniref:Uncharacterized protein n=1 Tax=Enterococcus caccae ATCC BAA-1240 TaxID=1158612 RepID=R3WTR8_9ENTE|nr:DUF916 and DUF3324 domain-containing protein [Enterococcus caccae]EOL45215.1 hypothetical protein UC7_02021 [Enterococcus caccae ATCC BAA-1240]EOT58622.1 hypothetical protein I580_02793 [Enterococcus caccae ATCC BAA-1240]OJG27050.1 hypothetical protein RU98_GL002830 [Enterococcus caccae]